MRGWRRPARGRGLDSLAGERTKLGDAELLAMSLGRSTAAISSKFYELRTARREAARLAGTYAGVNVFGNDRDAQLAMHPTVKPVAMVEDAVLDCSRRSGIVLDPFAGSGTTIIAAERAGRRGYGIEIDPGYVDTALRRYRTFTEDDPVRLNSGRTLSDLE